MTDIYHYAVLGGGVAGVMLSLQLARLLPDSKIALLDNSPSIRPRQTFSYFGRAPLAIETLTGCTLPKSSWSSWTIQDSANTRLFNSSKFCYNSIDSNDFFASLIQLINDCPNVDLVKTQVISQKYGNNHVAIATTTGSVRAYQVFSSIPDDKSSFALYQDFIGLRLQSDAAVFDPQVATLMDFTGDTKYGSHFMYLLPDSTNSALVESTLYRPHGQNPKEIEAFHREWLQRYISKLGTKIQLTGEERGILPLSAKPVDRFINPRTIAIGSRGGMLRASTGYALQNIDNDCQMIAECAARLSQTIELKASNFGTNLMSAITSNSRSQTQTGRLERLLDQAFIQTLQNDACLFATMIGQLANHVEANRLARFLSQSATFYDLLLIARQIGCKQNLTLATINALCPQGDHHECAHLKSA